MNKTVSLFRHLLFFGLFTTFAVVGVYKLSDIRIKKKAKEVERIESKTYEKTNCEQYALVATENGWFLCFKCGGRDSIFLYEGEVWKYGKTCNGQDGRYSSGLPFKKLRYRIQHEGNEGECLIAEKDKIYNYPNLPECKKRDFVLLRPPGNKIDK